MIIGSIRNSTKKINFSSKEMKIPMLERKEKKLIEKEHEVCFKEEKLKKRLEELDRAEALILNIQKEVEKHTQELEKREEEIEQKENDLKKRTDLWKELNEFDIGKLGREDIEKLSGGEDGFIKKLLESYFNLLDKKEDYVNEIKGLKEKFKGFKKEIEKLEG